MFNRVDVRNRRVRVLYMLVSLLMHLSRYMLRGMLRFHLFDAFLGLVISERVVLHHRTVYIQGLSGDLEGFTIGHISDLHIKISSDVSRAARAISLLQDAKPDLIGFTGDLVDELTSQPTLASEPLSLLSAPCGVFGVWGNHDHMVGAADMVTMLTERAANITFLANNSVCIQIRNTPFWIAGVDSAYCNRSDVRKTFSAVPGTDFCLVLTHEPDVADCLPRRVGLILAGHSHGGQLQIGGHPLLLPPKGIRYPDGVNSSECGPIHTSRGVGWTSIPIRIGCPAEVTIIHLTKLKE